MWASGDWDTHSRLIEPVGAVVLERIDLRPGLDLLDVGTGTGGNVAIPAALRGAKVVGLDIAPELFEHARRRAAEAGVEVEWVEGDAQDLPFADESFDRVVSTFGAMFAPDHERAAGELVRVCRAGGRVAMTTWVNAGYAAGLFKLSGTFLPPPPAGVQPPPLWGVESHVEEVFAAAGATPDITRETFDVCPHSPRAGRPLAGVRSSTHRSRPTLQCRRRRDRQDPFGIPADQRLSLTGPPRAPKNARRTTTSGSTA